MSEPSESPAPSSLPRPLPPMSWRDRIEELLQQDRSRLQWAGAAVAVAVVLLAAFLLLRPTSAAPVPELHLPMASSSTPSTSAVSLVVHAAGAVARPGVYRLPAGSRVDDLVTAAGGLHADADADRVNLAALLTDGDRVYVPRVGDPGGLSDSESGAPSGPLDLNRATETDLDALPGIGPATAKAIVDERARRGGRFASVDDLLDVRGIGPAKLEQLRDLVVVK